MFGMFFTLLLIFNVFSVILLYPNGQEIKEDTTVFLGTIGPGQTLAVGVDPWVYSGGINEIGGRYDIAYITELPAGWKATESDIYGTPLQIEITAAEDTEAGEYIVKILMEDEGNGEGLGNFTFYGKIVISWNVTEIDIYPSVEKVGAGQPGKFFVTIKNVGYANDVFVVSVENMPRWPFKKQVYVPSNSSRVVVYEITADEEETYSPVISVVSQASPFIEYTKEVELVVDTTLESDFKATNNGVLFFPISEGLLYSIAGLISSVIQFLFG